MKIKIKKSEALLLVSSTIFTLILALLIIRWLQPSLLGMPSDLVFVQSSKRVPPYYELIFNEKDLTAEKWLLNDPFVKQRAKQLLPDSGYAGPHDLLGFRNTHVPNYADVVLIGDSMTYGNNVPIWENWPSALKISLPSNISIYSMATGGWGSVQYYYAFLKSMVFSPKVIVVAFYTGNDAFESFDMVYGSKIWNEYIPNDKLDINDLPKAVFPPPEQDQSEVIFSDGIKTIFTPKHRRISIKKSPAIDAGYQIMINMAKEIHNICVRENKHIIFTVIPTKEYVYSKKIDTENMSMNDEYNRLISEESERLLQLKTAFEEMQGAVYVDVASKLRDASVNPVALYLDDVNGHPIETGYNIIAKSLADEINKYIEPINNGLTIIKTVNDLQMLVFIKGEKFWILDDPENININQDVTELQTLRSRRITNLKYMGLIKASQIDNINLN